MIELISFHVKPRWKLRILSIFHWEAYSAQDLDRARTLRGLYSLDYRKGMGGGPGSSFPISTCF